MKKKSNLSKGVSASMSQEEYSEKCRAHLATMPASEIWRMEHGDEVQRDAIATIKAAAGDRNKNISSSKKKVKEKSSEMSPRELARYAVANDWKKAEKTLDGVIDVKNSFYQYHLKNMDDSEYIEYLEQLVRETEHYWKKSDIFTLITSVEYFVKYEGGIENIEISDNDEIQQVLGKHPYRTLKEIYARMGEEFATTEYIKSSSSDKLTKGYWEKNDVDD